MLEVAADWHELVVPRCGMQPFIGRDSRQLDLWCSTTDIPLLQSVILYLHPVAHKFLLINQPMSESTCKGHRSPAVCDVLQCSHLLDICSKCWSPSVCLSVCPVFADLTISFRCSTAEDGCGFAGYLRHTSSCFQNNTLQ